LSESDQGEWFYAVGSTQHGPVPAETILQMIASGQLTPENLVWRDGMPQWMRAGDMPIFAPPIARPIGPTSIPPPPPPLGQPLGAYYPDPQTAALQSKASTAMAIGIISLVLSACVCGPAGVGMGIWAWIAGNQVPPGYPFSGQARAGVVCGIIGIVLGSLTSVFSVLWFFGAILSGI
jgi:hypothetical protein